MSDSYFVVPQSQHDVLVETAFRSRGYLADEAADGARLCGEASRHGIRTHNAIKALHLDQELGSGSKGCVPGAQIEEIPSRFPAAKIWNCHKKFGQSVGYRAMDAAIKLADQYGVGIVSVDNAFHYLWGGGYVMDAARRGYVAYTNCTGARTQMVPFGGKFPTMGTNPHSWGFPTTEVIGFPIVIDWASSVIAMGRVHQAKREGKQLPPMAAVDKEGNPTTDPHATAALLPFGAHKGYGLALVNELIAALIGCSMPTLRGKFADDNDRHTSAFFFQVIHPDALNSGAFARGRSQMQNVKAVLADILGHGNEKAIVPGQIEAEWAKRTTAAGGLLFTNAEIEAFNEIATGCGCQPWQFETLKVVSV